MEKLIGRKMDELLEDQMFELANAFANNDEYDGNEDANLYCEKGQESDYIAYLDYEGSNQYCINLDEEGNIKSIWKANN